MSCKVLPLSRLVQVSVLATVLWFSWFSHFQLFGLYEDDYALIAPFLDSSSDKIINYLYSCFTHASQGRPVGFSAAAVLTWIGSLLGGLSGVYIVAYLVVYANVILVFFILRQLLPIKSCFPLFGAIIFCIYPADTTKILLTHALILQFALQLFLAATLLYLHEKYIWSYILVCGSLLSYESTFATFLAVPLLTIAKEKNEHVNMKQLVRHVAIMFLIASLALLWRRYLGEERVLNVLASPMLTLKNILGSLFLGPLTNMKTLTKGLIIRQEMLPVSVWWPAIPFGVFCWLLLSSKTSTELNIIKANIINSSICCTCNLQIQKGAKLCLAGVTLLVFSYLLAFTHYPPTAIEGRATSVHLTASFAGSVLLTGLMFLAFEVTQSRVGRFVIIFAIVVELTILSCYSRVIQLDFVRSWSYQQIFWREFVSACPDLQDGTIVLVSRNDLTETTFIYSHSWADAIIVQNIFLIPIGWKKIPRLLAVDNGIEESVRLEDGRLYLQLDNSLNYLDTGYLPDGNVILLSIHGGKLVRQFGTMLIHGIPLRLKPFEINQQKLLIQSGIGKYLLGK